MSDNQNDLEKLMALAQETSSEKRRELMRSLTDVFFDAPEAFTGAELDHFSTIMGRIAFEVEVKVRAEFADRLADVDCAPHELVRQLAEDEITVARPLLTRSKALGDDDLVAIAEAQGQEHMLAMTKRPELSEAVSAAIVSKGTDTVLESLIRNKGARLSRESMETVVSRAEGNERLHAPLLNRKDLAPDLMTEMFWFVSNRLKEHIVARTAKLDPQVVEKLLQESESRIAVEMNRAAEEAGPAEAFIQRAVRNRELNEKLLIQLLREKRMAELILGFAHLAEIDEGTARRILTDKSHAGLAIACKAARFDRSTFSTLVLIADPEGTRSVDETYELLALYDKVPTDAAQRTMRFWRVRRRALEEDMEVNAA